MKKVILLALLMPSTAFGQILENFEPGNINNWVQSTGGRWKADTTSTISGRFSLHHIFDNPDSGTDHVGIPLNTLHPSQGLTRWSFLIKYGYDPSSSNNWSAMLLSDTSPVDRNVEGNAGGFAIGVNITGYDDTLRLWKVKGDAVTPVVNCNINWQNDIGITNAVRITVERTTEGKWTVSVYLFNGTHVGTSTGEDRELFITGWFVISYRYSSTRDQLLWFDDLNIEGIFYEDNEPPLITSCNVSGKNSLEITFSESPADDFLIPENFSLNNVGKSPVSVEKKSGLIYIIKFADDFINKSLNKLIIRNICDRTGNCITNTQIPFTPVWSERGDIIISEIMADPEPVVSLPGKEYLEITNRTRYSFNLKNWKLISESQVITFPEIIIQPSEVIIICNSQDTSLFLKYGKVKGLKQFPTLTDGGRILCLSDSLGNLIHGVEYSSAWYNDELKSDGGWSLEMIDTGFPFYYDGNWTASESRKGGSPGSINSVAGSNQDNSFIGVVNVFPEDSINITVRFSEPVFDLCNVVNSIKIGNMDLTDINPVDPLFREFTVRPASPLQTGKMYQFTIPAVIKDFAGNEILKAGYTFGLPEPPAPGDILFNEILFNSFPGDPDYLELYNCSEKVIDAFRLQVVSVNDEMGSTSQISGISVENRCIIPGSFYAFTTDIRRISERYLSSNPEFLFETGSLPSMSDDEGHLILFSRELEQIDEVYYSEKMQSSLLTDCEGVALEKNRPVNKSGDAVNWHSASESSGWGTPGAPNSVFAEIPANSDKVFFSSTKITPDTDGYEDNLVIQFSLTGVNNVVSALVFDETGSYIRKVAANMLLGPESSLIWDGTADDGSLVSTGIYIVFITLFDDTGKSERWKKVCTVIRN